MGRRKLSQEYKAAWPNLRTRPSSVQTVLGGGQEEEGNNSPWWPRKANSWSLTWWKQHTAIASLQTIMQFDFSNGIKSTQSSFIDLKRKVETCHVCRNSEYYSNFSSLVLIWGVIRQSVLSLVFIRKQSINKQDQKMIAQTDSKKS